MVAGNKKSHSLRRVKVKTPGGRVTIHYKRRKPNYPKCGITGQILPGVARGTSTEVRKLARSERKPSRPYGGNYSSKASRMLLKLKDAKIPANAKDAKGLDVGTLCMKIAGRDAGNVCTIISLNDGRALIDGGVRRKECNLSHLHPLGKSIEIKNGASHEDVVKQFEDLKLSVWKKTKKENKTEKPIRKNKVKKSSKKTATKKASKKETKVAKE